ncbi:S26 family signal peptidase [Natrinema sp. 1APR25-10V2]|uniref:S26 family signal peptidase n=1 Tax=Natrinema sp. 1APR25-10V2 TaxID=2951081 RepID=UPI00287555AC|nr:S26 family signal peptidase [Natrinema sp. 1APR25-10V2]MDS0476769.1 S26 family signal peptidase [Natrinema sp. 1APR25-10V2]
MTDGRTDADRGGDGRGRRLPYGDDETAVFVRDVVSVVAIVAAVALVLFAVSGIWPPFVAVESGSMEPNVHTGDLVFVVQEERFVGDDPVAETGIVPIENSRGGDERLGRAGDVIVFQPNGNPSKTPVIHRAYFWVEDGENWIRTSANPAYTYNRPCAEIESCPAPHDGFITKGDASGVYDQIGGNEPKTTVVRPGWIVGKAMVRIPWLGNVRLLLESLLGLSVVGPVAMTTLR